MKRVTLAAVLCVAGFILCCYLLLAACLAIAMLRQNGVTRIVRMIPKLSLLSGFTALTALPDKTQRRPITRIAVSGVAIAFVMDATPSTSGTGLFIEDTGRFLKGGYLNERDSAAIVRLDDQPRLLYGVEHVGKTRPLYDAALACGKPVPGRTGSDPCAALDIAQLWLRNYPAKRRILVVYSDLIPDPTRDGKRVIRRFRDPLTFAFDSNIEVWLIGLNPDILAKAQRRFPRAHAYLTNHRLDIGRELGLKASDF